jgi:hypothetical protein
MPATDDVIVKLRSALAEARRDLEHAIEADDEDDRRRALHKVRLLAQRLRRHVDVPLFSTRKLPRDEGWPSN